MNQYHATESSFDEERFLVSPNITIYSVLDKNLTEFLIVKDVIHSYVQGLIDLISNKAMIIEITGSYRSLDFMVNYYDLMLDFLLFSF